MGVDLVEDRSESDRAKILVKGVSKRFASGGQSVEALSELDCEVREGEFVCLVGPSGCGKSTLLRMIAALERPSSGTIEVRRDGTRQVLCSVVFQDYSIFPWKTVSANVAFGLRMSGVNRREAHRIAREWISRVGLDGFEDAYPATLSGGMKQRVALARALAVDPEVLLLDEPFAALDPQLRTILQEDLLRLWEEGKSRTAILVTHSLEEAALLGDRILLLSKRPGELRADIEVPFARPRSPELRAAAEFVQFRESVWSLLKEDVG